jgi:Type IV secretion system pilin
MIPQQLFTLFAADPCQPHDFLGLVPWYHYLTLTPSTDAAGHAYCDIGFTVLSGNSSDIPLVILAVVDDLLRIAGIVAVAFIIYGAIQYIASQGNPEQTARAQSTVINALIGMAIAIVSIATVSYIGSSLGG